ncbi:MAG TPA: ATP-binding protein [Candidatus Methylacidiphilales bacterium]|jgi:signal transduction histidine kinase|nr:ATP-binding protein [Candidatus Methylacidiphilales bacterium]
MSEPLRIIHVEDSPQDVDLIKHSLVLEGYAPEVKRVETRAELLDALTHDEFDLILSDYTLPKFSGSQALEIASAIKPDVPFIFVSGTIQEGTAVESLRNGATDYVLKDRPARLVSAIRRALRERKESSLHTALEKRLHQARRLQAVSTLAGDVARDVSRLLLKIKNHAHALSRECADTTRAHDLIGKLIDTTDEGSELMQQLLAFARRSEAHLLRVETASFLEEATAALRVLLPSSIEIKLRMAEGLPALFADPEHIRRMLTNLALNSRDAMPEGGTITLSADVIEFDPIPAHLSDIADAPYLCVTLSDDGVGMDEATRLRVFEPYFTTKFLRNGAGLGLPEVYGLMRTHNGLIDIQSQPGTGTRVSLFFPLRREGQPLGQIRKIPPIQMAETSA